MFYAFALLAQIDMVGSVSYSERPRRQNQSGRCHEIPFVWCCCTDSIQMLHFSTVRGAIIGVCKWTLKTSLKTGSEYRNEVMTTKIDLGI